MVPRLGLKPGQWLLRMPAPLVGTATEGLLAYRLEGMEATPSPQNLSIGTVSLDEFARTWTRLAQRESPVVSRAASFRRTAPTAALGLAVQPVRPAAQFDLAWKVGPRHADLTARVA